MDSPLTLAYRLMDARVESPSAAVETGWRSFADTVIAVVSEGRCSIETATERIEIAAGQGFLVPAGLRHRVRNPSTLPLVIRTTHLRCLIHEAAGLFTVLRSPARFGETEAGRIHACHERLMRLRRDRPTLAVSVDMSIQVAELVRLALGACPELEELWAGPERERTTRILRYVHDHLGEPISRDDLARVAGLSLTHLHTLCLRTFRTTPMELVRRERMNRARELLHRSRIPVAEIAMWCGFPDPYYFSRAFRRVEGIPPSRYRMQRWAEDMNQAW